MADKNYITGHLHGHNTVASMVCMCDHAVHRWHSADTVRSASTLLYGIGILKVLSQKCPSWHQNSQTNRM